MLCKRMRGIEGFVIKKGPVKTHNCMQFIYILRGVKTDHISKMVICLLKRTVFPLTGGKGEKRVII